MQIPNNLIRLFLNDLIYILVYVVLLSYSFSYEIKEDINIMDKKDSLI